MGNARTIGLSTLVAAVIAAATTALAFPPEPAPVPQAWEFDVDFGPLHAATVEIEVIGPEGKKVLQPMAFFYMTYTVMNNTGQDLLFAPSFELGTDKGQILRAGRRDVPRKATQELLRRLENPFLLDQISILGKLQQGEENAKEGLIVWPLDDLTIDEAAVYAEGFSGETDTIEWIDPENGEVIKVILRKTYEQRFATPGTIDPTNPKPFRLKERPRWIMR